MGWIHETIRNHATDTTLGGSCGQDPITNVYHFDPGVTPICGADGCRILCDNSDLSPNVDRVTCVNRKLSPAPNKVRRIGCAETAAMFSPKCGAISQDIAFPDLDKMTVFCTTTKCSISPKAEFANNCEPSITQIKCQGNDYNYDYDVVRCEPKKSTVKRTGRQFKCHAKKGWSPPTYNGKIWCHQTYMSDGSYDNAKSIWESMQNQ